MSAETFTTAMFLITAVIAAGVLVNAVFPVVYNMAGTFSSATHESDERLRTDFKIVTYTATPGNPGSAKIWMKNIGSSRIPISDFTNRSDVFCGATGSFSRLTWAPSGTTGGTWTEAKYDTNNNGYWDPGETILVNAYTSIPSVSSGQVYFQFILPSGIWRSIEFNAAS
jgi:flagellar protein FlaG